MAAQKAAFILFALALLSTALFAADDYGGAGIRIFCQQLLNAGANNSLNSTPAADTNGTGGIPKNFTYGTKHNETLARLGEANASVARMREAGLPYLQANDLLEIGVQWFDGQSAMELSGGIPDYGFSLQKVTEILDLEQSSLSVGDDLKALSARIDSADKDANLTSTKALMAEATQEFRDGRIDEAKNLINQAYDEVSNAESQAVHSRTMLESTRRNLESFLSDNWKIMVAIAAIALALFFVFQKQIRRFILDSRLKALIHEREVVSSMLKGLQQDYFQKKTINELTYRVKTKKYGDMLRNINRQVPTVKEELKKV